MARLQTIDWPKVSYSKTKILSSDWNWTVNENLKYEDAKWLNWTITNNNYIITSQTMPASITYTTTNIPYITTTAQTTAIYTQAIWQEWFQSQQIPDGSIVEIPGTVIATGQWDAWVAAEAIEQDRRQAAREAYNQAQQEIARKKALNEAARIAADARAKALLFEHLNEDQQKSWNEHKLFDKIIHGSTYRFTYGSHGNVSKIEKGHIVERFCIAPVAPHDGGVLPIEDIVLAQMVLLQCDEKSFRKIANVSQYREPQPVRVAPPVVVEATPPTGVGQAIGNLPGAQLEQIAA